jgi:hypothetical protein
VRKTKNLRNGQSVSAVAEEKITITPYAYGYLITNFNFTNLTIGKRRLFH